MSPTLAASASWSGNSLYLTNNNHVHDTGSTINVGTTLGMVATPWSSATRTNVGNALSTIGNGRRTTSDRPHQHHVNLGGLDHRRHWARRRQRADGSHGGIVTNVAASAVSIGAAGNANQRVVISNGGQWFGGAVTVAGSNNLYQVGGRGRGQLCGPTARSRSADSIS